jgi:uncharacterized protein (TIGR02099 family)
LHTPRTILSAGHTLLRLLHTHAGEIAGRGFLLLATMVYFAFAIVVIGLRYWVLPGIENYRGDIEQAVSFGLGRRVTIESVEANWHGLNPYLALHKVAIFDESNRPALEFGLVESTLSWSSLWHLEVRQHTLEVWRPSLTIRRDRNGQIFVAGIALSKSDGGDGRAAGWLMAQHEISIRDADLAWIDEQRAAPPLALAHVDFLLENSGSRHRFALRALPPREHASALELRGDLNGDNATELAQWRGQIYANLAYADLAAWRAWIDYPIDIRQGRGGLRLWAEIKEQQLRGLTADVGLADLIARLDPQLAELELRQLQGRFQFTYTDAGYSIGGNGVNFRSSTGVVMAPADFLVRISHAPGGEGGEIRANAVDLHELAQLADYLPLDPAVHSTLAKYAPQGKVYGMQFGWTGALEKPKTYSLQSRFAGLGINPVDAMPGFSGLSGNINADEAKGALALDAQHAAVELPALFENSHLPFDSLSASLTWRQTASGYNFDFGSIAFANADAAGNASGSYHTVAGGPGVIDLNARLTRAEVHQVSRYLPRRVHDNVRAWAARALVAGTSQDARLRLKGDLARFPFVDDQEGIFQVVAKVQGGKLDYSEAWPAIDNIVADVVFHGRQLEVNATQGAVLGTRLGRTRAEIPDLANKEEKSLNIVGTAEGATAEFLRFVDISPVARMTDDVTHDMGASGNGKLTLKIILPLPTLNHPVPVARPKIGGSFQFASNQISFEPSLPPISQFNGRLDFTESGLTARNLSGNFLGGATTLSIASRPDTGIAVQVQGVAGMEALQHAVNYPWLKKLSGNTAWRASMAVRRRAIDFTLDSSLAGIESELPEPLKKSVSDPMPLRVERHVAAADVVRGAAATRTETWQLTLGKTVGAQWIAQASPAGSEVMRAGLAFNEAASLPASGFAVSGRLAVLDFDQWRELMPASGDAERFDGVKLNLRVGTLDALGRRLNDVDFHSELKQGTWQTSIRAREMEGKIDWQPKGQGRVVATLKQFTLPDASPGAQARAKHVDTIGDLPELDLVADSFVVHDKTLGRLELAAANVAHDWNIKKLLLSSPEGSLSADGVWQNYVVQPRTDLNIHLAAKDVGKLLERLGFPGSMRRGEATLDGKLAWLGSPQSIDYPSLSGNLKLDARKGQFSKIEPGIGKLLGILSLQALPRHLTLDFNDVFSEGFAFDQLSGNVAITRGVMSTNDLKIDGPSAKVQIKGIANLANESVELRVHVEPAASGVTLATCFVNPIVCGALFLGNTAFKNPLGQIFAYDYKVAGSWMDPKVEKLRGPSPPTAASQATPAPFAVPGPILDGVLSIPAPQLPAATLETKP